jgi:hypothetical protein
MIQAIGLGLLAGLLIGNGLPHLVKGVTRERYPTVFGSGPVANFLAGWVGMCVAVAALVGADLPASPIAGGAAIAVGVLLAGLFHARIGAFGRR